MRVYRRCEVAVVSPWPEAVTFVGNKDINTLGGGVLKLL